MSRDVDLMRRAIGEHRLLAFDYTRADGERSERSVRPLALHFWGNKWTLAAWCELRRDYRSFRPDRMQVVRSEGRVRPGPELSLLFRTLSALEEMVEVIKASDENLRLIRVQISLDDRFDGILAEAETYVAKPD